MDSTAIIGIIVGLIAGLGLFLYGMNLMGDGLQKAAGDKLKSIIEMLTKNRFIAVFVGIFVTAIIQSSSATTVMVVGFVNAGIMQLSQAIGIIMGANVGTTVTAQLVSFDIEALAPITVGIGVLMLIASKNERTKSVAEILIGFGILFVGMVYMKDAVRPLREVAAFKEMLVNFGHNPILGIAMGFGLTLLLQSSSASIGILLALAAEGMLPLASALPILYGDNIGTCTTALISSIGASKNAQRAAIMHLTFNVVGTLLFALLLNPFVTKAVTTLDPSDIGRQVANAHTIFNISNVIIQFPFAGLIVKFAQIVIPETKDERMVTSVTHLDPRMLNTPSIALQNTISECLDMGEVSRESLEAAIKGLLEKDTESIKKCFALEKIINQKERAILEYLILLSNTAISGNDRMVVDSLFNTIHDIERVGDHAENIGELAENIISGDLNFSEDSRKDILNMYSKVVVTFEKSLLALKTKDIALAKEVILMEEEVDEIEKVCRNGHIYRLNRSLCNPESGIIFLDLLSNLERVSDHATNIAGTVIDARV